MSVADVVGWASSLVLVCTIGSQVAKQWRDGKSEGVSKWLFIGQVAASAGFVVYSVALHSWVFVVTNSLMLASALVGGAILYRNRRRQRRPGIDRRAHSDTPQACSVDSSSASA